MNLCCVRYSSILYCLPSIPASIKEVVSDLVKRINRWRKSINHQYGHKSQEQPIIATDAMLSPDDLVEAMRSPVALKGRKAFEDAGAGLGISEGTFVAAQDFLIVVLAQKNGSRPGPLQDATVGDYARSRIGEASGNRVILIPRNKSPSQGPAKLVLDEELRNWMSLYMARLRPRFCKKDVDNLFITKDGDPFTSIGKRLTEFWGKFLVRSDVRVTHTSIRKLVSTAAQEQFPQNSAEVERLMSHSAHAASAIYYLPSLAKDGCSGFSVVKRALEVGGPSSKEPTSKKMKIVLDNIATDDPSYEQPSTSVHQHEEYRTILSRDDKDEIAVIFSEEIRSLTNPSMETVRQRVARSARLRHLAKAPNTIKAISEMIRTCWHIARNNTRGNLAKLHRRVREWPPRRVHDGTGALRILPCSNVPFVTFVSGPGEQRSKKCYNRTSL